MKEKYGIVLLDPSEIVIRIYETDTHEWKLLHYHDILLDGTANAMSIAEKITDFLMTEPAQHIIEWRTCARDIPQAVVQKIATITSLTIENLTPLREQELLCKGIFTELW